MIIYKIGVYRNMKFEMRYMVKNAVFVIPFVVVLRVGKFCWCSSES
jgi:hypothetical protein